MMSISELENSKRPKTIIVSVPWHKPFSENRTWIGQNMELGEIEYFDTWTPIILGQFQTIEANRNI